MLKIILGTLLVASTLFACQTQKAPVKKQDQPEKLPHLVNDIAVYNSDSTINVVVEISAGSTEKWEVNKKSGKLERDSINGKPRTINYLGYPANYGFVPQTLLSKKEGGDGDPLDAIILGAQLPQGSINSCTVLGVLKLIDGGEQDDKLILATKNSIFSSYLTLDELHANHPGMLDAIASWFTHYKGPDIVISGGYASAAHAKTTIKSSHNQFVTNSSK